MERINADQPDERPIEGKRIVGPDQVLLHMDDDLTADTPWKDAGFTIAPFLEDTLYRQLLEGFRQQMINAMRNAGCTIPDDFGITEYHQYIGTDNPAHIQVVQQLTRLPVNQLPIDADAIRERITEIVNLPLSLQNPQTGRSTFHLRIIRPHSNDFNPLHRDSWLDNLRNGINLYVPIGGSNSLSSLCVVPGSHHWKESEIERTLEGAVAGGTSFQVPALTGSSRDLHVIRPDPGYNQVLIFSPYLIHGGGSNRNAGTTRVSLEMRLWRAAK